MKNLGTVAGVIENTKRELLTVQVLLVMGLDTDEYRASLLAIQTSLVKLQNATSDLQKELEGLL